MPEKLDRCVKSVKADGKSESSAYAICTESTGYKVGKGSTKKDKKWVKKRADAYKFACMIKLADMNKMLNFNGSLMSKGNPGGATQGSARMSGANEVPTVRPFNSMVELKGVSSSSETSAPNIGNAPAEKSDSNKDKSKLPNPLNSEAKPKAGAPYTIST